MGTLTMPEPYTLFIFVLSACPNSAMFSATVCPEYFPPKSLVPLCSMIVSRFLFMVGVTAVQIINVHTRESVDMNIYLKVDGFLHFKASYVLYHRFSKYHGSGFNIFS